MQIDINKCIGCGICLKFCTVGAISISDKKAVINVDECVDCGFASPQGM